jgi:hypothetical protein
MASGTKRSTRRPRAHRPMRPLSVNSLDLPSPIAEIPTGFWGCGAVVPALPARDGERQVGGHRRSVPRSARTTGVFVTYALTHSGREGSRYHSPFHNESSQLNLECFGVTIAGHAQPGQMERAEQQIQQLVSEVGSPASIETVVIVGSPAEDIARSLSRGALGSSSWASTPGAHVRTAARSRITCWVWRQPGCWHFHQDMRT